MAKLGLILVITLQVILPYVLTETVDKARFFGVPQAAATGAGAAYGNQYDKGQSGSETHNDMSVGFNLDKKQGTSQQQSHDRGQDFGAGGFGAVSAPVYAPYRGWGGWPSPPPPPPPQFGWGFPPVQQGWGVPFRGWGGFPQG